MGTQARAWAADVSKRALLVLLAAATALCCLVPTAAVSAWAAGITSTSTASITVSGAESGVTVTAYKVASVNWDETAQQYVDPQYTWNSAVVSWVSSNYSDYIDTTSSNAVTSTFAALLSEATEDNATGGSELAAFYDDLAAAITASTVSLDAAATGTVDSNGDATLSDVAMGVYLVVLSNGTSYVYKPSSANVVPVYDEDTSTYTLSDVAIEVKSSSIGISIEGSDPDNDGSVAIGDTVSYTATANVPAYAGSASDTYSITIAVSSGLSIDSSTIKVTGDSTSLTAGTEYTLTANEDGTYTLTFDYDAIAGYSSIVVTYDATVTSSATPGTAMYSTATLEWSNGTYTTGTKSDDATSSNVYTYGAKILKVAKSDSETTLSGATFTLALSGTTLYFTTNSDGAYILSSSSAEDATTDLVSDSSGTITIIGLDEGEYTLTETKAPSGYVKLASALTLTVTADDDDPTVVVDDTDAYTDLTVTNTAGVSLPSTGGMGTLLLTLAGIVLVLAAAGVLLSHRRRSRAQR